MQVPTLNVRGLESAHVGAGARTIIPDRATAATGSGATAVAAASAMVIVNTVVYVRDQFGRDASDVAWALGASGAPAPLFQGPPFRSCLVGGLILAEDGQKMSKSKKNYVSPDVVFASQGADATRWYLLSTTAPWQDKRFYEEAVRETFGKFFSTLWNTFLFHHQYARLDRWTPAKASPPEEWGDLDRWLLSRLNATVAEARAEADRLHLHKATRAIEAVRQAEAWGDSWSCGSWRSMPAPVPIFPHGAA
mgnify:CR=1 FL=1